MNINIFKILKDSYIGDTDMKFYRQAKSATKNLLTIIKKRERKRKVTLSYILKIFFNAFKKHNSRTKVVRKNLS